MFPLYAMSESVLVPAIVGSSLLLALALGTADTTTRRWYLAGVAFVAAFSTWANPRGLAIVLAGIAIVALLAVISDSWRVGDVLIVIGVAAVTVLVGNVVNGLIVGDIVAPGSDASNYLGTVKDVSLWRRWPRISSAALGTSRLPLSECCGSSFCGCSQSDHPLAGRRRINRSCTCRSLSSQRLVYRSC